MNEPVGGASGAAAAEPDTPGGMLRVERERRGYSVQHAAEDMHLDAWVIQAIEANRFEALGAPVYARGHLRKYAALLGLSPATVIERYEALGGTPVDADADSGRDSGAGAIVERRRVSKLPLWIAAAIAIVAGLAWLVFELLVEAEFRQRDDERSRCADRVGPGERAGRTGATGTGGSSAGTGCAGASGGSNVSGRGRSPAAPGVHRAVVGRDLRRLRASG